jgi:hypothetical protein
MDRQTRKSIRHSWTAGILLAAAALAGCGNGGGAKTAAPAAQSERFVFISAKDCAESGRLKLQQCGDAIDAAIAAHLATAPTYVSLRACEATEGGDRCERTDNKAYRPRLVAFLFNITGDAVKADPLYPPPGTEAGLRQTDKKKIVLTTDDAVTYSPLALAAYESNKGDANNPASTSAKQGL